MAGRRPDQPDPDSLPDRNRDALDALRGLWAQPPARPEEETENWIREVRHTRPGLEPPPSGANGKRETGAALRRGGLATIHLDTSFLIAALHRDRPERSRLEEWLVEGVDIGISAVAWGDFCCGPATAAERSAACRLLPEPVPLTGPDGETAARLFNLSGRRRSSFEACLIAAVAMSSDAAIATRNPPAFRWFQSEGLIILTTSA